MRMHEQWPQRLERQAVHIKEAQSKDQQIGGSSSESVLHVETPVRPSRQVVWARDDRWDVSFWDLEKQCKLNISIWFKPCKIPTHQFPHWWNEGNKIQGCREIQAGWCSWGPVNCKALCTQCAARAGQLLCLGVTGKLEVCKLTFSRPSLYNQCVALGVV